jgi:uncharacterized protein (DUF58 family)
VSAIDWRRSASSDRLFVREREWEAAHTVWLWLDLSPSMRFRSFLSETSKESRAVVLALGLTELLARAGERIGLMGRSPSSGRYASRKVAEVLLTETSDDSFPPGARLNRFSECVLFSDFLEPIDELVERFHQIASQGVRGHLVQILDPAEETLPYEGRTEFEASEGGATMIVGRAEDLREKYQRRIERHRLDLQETARQLGWSFVLHHTDRPAEEVLLAIHGQLSGQDRDYRYRAARRPAEAAEVERGAGS